RRRHRYRLPPFPSSSRRRAPCARAWPEHGGEPVVGGGVFLGKIASRRLADHRDAERINESLQPDLAACLDRRDQLGGRLLGPAFTRGNFLGALVQSEDIDRA